MRKVIVVNIMSLDGCYEGPGGNVMALPMDAAFDRYNLERIETADTVLLGGGSYALFQGFWPGVAQDPAASATNQAFAKRYNAIDKVVVADHATRPAAGHPWADNTTIVARADAHAKVRALKAENGGDIVVFASRVLWHDLLAHGLVDELHLMVGATPVGAGTPLFSANVAGLHPIDTRTFYDSGNVLLRYRVEQLA
ncbi:dihydrofolate reductase [Nocardia tenerifensis]|uniref:Dihydrofolate reductase n=1 Tax=Nocardia tenerifensis TaxID=228006 RepID=A0A318KU57_9NOCA|nr:dihydrofolate reductase family protein [Nocardia tenerifensis]PXX67047.1 dihydrofolate reductase [Nocardia tenerifensis]